MALSVFTHVPSLSFQSLAALQQFQGTDAEMHFPDPSAFSRTSAIAQERAKAFFLHLEKKLSTQSGKKSPLQILLERISKLPQTKENRPLIAAITQAFFKQRGYLSRLFSDESWEEWTENRTALGKVASQFQDCVESSTRVSHFTKRQEKRAIQQANKETNALLRRFEHWKIMKTTTFQPMRCITGFFGGTVSSLLTNSPLPLVIGLSECFPKVFAQQKVGSEFHVNTYTTDTQMTPSVAGLSNGNFIVTWVSDGQDGSGFGIFGQLFDKNANKIGSEFQVNTYTVDNQGGSSLETRAVASLNNCNFVVMWESANQDGSLQGIFGQLFYENTTKIGSEFQANNYTNNNQMNPSIASLSNDNFVVTWTSTDQDGSGDGVYGQLFDRNGNRIGNESQINAFIVNDQSESFVAGLTNGNFVVTWNSALQDGDLSGIFGQLFTDIWTKIGSEFQINTYTRSAQSRPSVASLSNGNFVVTWDSYGQDGSGVGIFAQLFNESGSKFGNEFGVNIYLLTDQSTPSVASFSNDNFVVTWTSSYQDGDDSGIYGQLFDKNGTKIGSEFQVNSYIASEQWCPSVASFNNGNFIVTWTSFGQEDGISEGIFGQIFYDNITISSITSASTIKTISTVTNNNILPSSNPKRSLLWLWVLLGITGGTTCIGLTGYFLLKKQREQRENNTSPLALTTFSPGDPERNLSDRDEKGHTRIGGKYDLINKISRDEAQTLLEQTGIVVAFPDRQYRTKVLLGEGYFGKLRIARDLYGRYIGVKKIKGEDQIAQSRNEGVLQKKLEGCSHIMPILDFVESTSSQKAPVLYQFMPLAGFGNGQKLRDQLQTLSDPAQKEQILIHVAKGLLTGLSHMHKALIYHLDIKPSNVVLDMQGEPFIIDFGCAKELPGGLIREQMTGDTEYYSPERIRFYRQVSNHQQPDPIAADKIDAWALGVSLLEIATGHYPFDRIRFSGKIKHWDDAYFQAKLDALPLLENPAPGSFMSIVKGLLVVDPQKRLSVEDALEQFAHIIPFPSPSEQQAAFANLKQQPPSSTEPPVCSIPRDQDERYAAVFTRRYELTPDSVHPEYGLTPNFVSPPASSQASSASIPMRIPPSYEEVMRAE